MDIDKKLYTIEKELELYEDANEPDTRLEIKQNINSMIKEIRQYFQSNDKKVPTDTEQSLKDFEEVLSY